MSSLLLFLVAAKAFGHLIAREAVFQKRFRFQMPNHSAQFSPPF